jgi:hypothetical protein
MKKPRPRQGNPVMKKTGVQPAVCPLPVDVLPGNFQKYVDPKMPVALRMRGAKALVPMGPTNITTALFILTFDPDATVRETAVKSAAVTEGDKSCEETVSDEARSNGPHARRRGREGEGHRRVWSGRQTAVAPQPRTGNCVVTAPRASRIGPR